MYGMKQFKVISSRLANFSAGATVSEDDLAGANVEALLSGGHIAEVGSKFSKKDNDKQPKVEE
jgi:hypothetical protein